MTVGITGVSGALGRLVAARLLDAMDPADIVVTSRTPESLADFGERGAQVRHADFDDPSSLASAFTGVDNCYWSRPIGSAIA